MMETVMTRCFGNTCSDTVFCFVDTVVSLINDRHLTNFLALMDSVSYLINFALSTPTLILITTH
jgi:hypothetical protein